MRQGRRTNTELMDLLNTAEFAHLGHIDAAKRLADYHFIKRDWSTIGEIRRKHKIPWTNLKVGTKYMAEMRKQGIEPGYSELIEKLGICPEYAEILVLGG